MNRLSASGIIMIETGAEITKKFAKAIEHDAKQIESVRRAKENSWYEVPVFPTEKIGHIYGVKKCD